MFKIIIIIINTLNKGVLAGFQKSMFKDFNFSQKSEF